MPSHYLIILCLAQFITASLSGANTHERWVSSSDPSFSVLAASSLDEALLSLNAETSNACASIILANIPNEPDRIQCTEYNTVYVGGQ